MQTLYNLLSTQRWPIAEQNQLSRQHALHISATTIITIIIIIITIIIIIINGVSVARGETREHAATVNLIICGEAHANEKKGEWRWGLRKDLAEQCSYVMCGVILSCFSLFLLTRHLHLNAWQQAAEERCGNKSWDCVRATNKNKRGGLKTEGKRKSYFGQRRFRWPDFLGRYLWREQENYFLVSPSSEISPVAYCCSLLQESCGCLIMHSPVSGTCNWFLRD